MYSQSIRQIWPLVLVALLLAACGGDGLPEEAPTTPASTAVSPIAPTPSPIATLSSTPAAEDPATAIKVLSYNVLYGGGVNRDFDAMLPQTDRPIYGGRSRLSEILEVLKSEDFDIIGIQEANGWNLGNPSVAEQVANELGMNYFLAETPRQFHVVLFTKYQVIEVEDVSPQLGINGGIRAHLQLPDGQGLHVFVVHFTPDSLLEVACQVKTLQQLAQPFYSQRILMLGDVNAGVGSPAVQQLILGGWTNVTAVTVDQVWVGPLPASSFKAVPIEIDRPEAVSDHPPVGANITFESSPIDTTFSIPAISSEACDNPILPGQSLAISEGDGVEIPGIGLSAPLRLGVLTGGAFPEPAGDGVTAYDTSILPGFGGTPGSGNLILAALECCAFKDIQSLTTGMKITILHAGETYDYSTVAVCTARKDQFPELFHATEKPSLTLFRVPVESEFFYALAELETDVIPDSCPVGQAN